jgi:predicted Zn finger-like uncharacterized protein
MLTRCPACETTFRITPEQLKARQGRVRCGHCQHVFNALDTLIEEVVATMPAVAIASAPATESSTLPEPAHQVSPQEKAEAADVDFVLDAGEPALESPSVSEAATPDEVEPAVTSSVVTDIAADVATPAYEEAIDDDASLDSSLGAEPMLHEDLEPRRRAWPWAIAALLTLFVLALQAALLYRVELAVLYPESRPLLEEACNLIGCEIALPSKPELMSIESSDLHPDTSQPGRLQLVATLKNRAPFAQAYPHLELTLTDTADQALARKVLVPSDYLSKDIKPQAGFAANKDLAVTLNLDAGSLPAAGYRLYLFYP